MALYSFEELVTRSASIEDARSLANCNEINLTTIGKKAQSLIEMTATCAQIPQGFVIDIDSLKGFLTNNNLFGVMENVSAITDFENSNAILAVDAFQNGIINGVFEARFLAELEEKLEQFHCKNFAVRSSGNCEDLKNASFAGLYETKLNISGITHLCKAIKQCWASLFSERVIRYSLNNGIELSRMTMSVIIQQMIPAEKSGVLFSINPLTGNDKEMVIEACFGLGEALVSGEVTPDQYIYNWYESAITSSTVNTKKIGLFAIETPPFVKTFHLSKTESNTSSLGPGLLKELVDIAMGIQSHYGHPVDIEWAYYDHQFYIVQSRPITKINYSAIEGEWTTADFKDGGVSSSVCSPFMWSLYDYVWESELPKYLAEVNLLGDKPVTLWGNMYYGRPYWNVGAVKEGLKKLPGFNERSFDQDLGVAVAYEGDGYVTKTSFKSILAGLKALRGLNRRFDFSQSNWKKFKTTQQARLEELKNFDVDQLSQSQFFEFYTRFINQEYFQSEAGYFNQIYDNSNLVTLFKEKLAKLNSPTEFIDLIAGLEEVSHLNLNTGIWRLSRQIRTDSDALCYWQTTCSTKISMSLDSGVNEFCIPGLKALISENYFHSTRELDITVPRYSEDPCFIIESIQSNLVLNDTFDPKIIAAKQRRKLAIITEQFSKSLPFYKRSSIMRSLKRLREFLWWREEFRDLSTHFYYYVRQYTLKLSPQFIQWRIIKQDNELFFLTKDQIIDVLEGRLEHTKAAEIVRLNICYYRSFRNFTNPNELGGQYHDLTDPLNPPANGIIGIPCSSGEVRGKVKVIKSIADAGRLEKGDILITRFTDPGWTPKFSLISAVATETGGVLSHAAVLSREYGIPAVLAIPGITETLCDGQMISINGTTGVIEILEEEEMIS